MEYTHEEFIDYWLYNDNTIIIKPHFNADINLINFNNKIVSLIFTNYEKIEHVIKKINNNILHGVICRFSEFNQSVDNLPITLQNLTFGHKFNQSVDNLPHNLTKLTFGNRFNCTVDNLPHTLLDLTFVCCFNQHIDNLPQNLTNLNLGWYFNKSVDNLPHGILNLTFGFNFNQPVDNLPNRIINLTFREGFNQSVNNLPYSLITLYFINESYYDDDNNQICKFDYLLNNLPNSICEIMLPNGYNQEMKIFPSSLKTIHCSSSYKFLDNFDNIENIYLNE